MRRAAFVFWLLASAAHLLGQANVKPPAASVRLVELNVFASDAEGHPVTDLQASELRLRENKSALPILYFGLARERKSQESANAGEFRNPPGAPPVVILIDRYNEGQLGSKEVLQDLDNTLQHLDSTEGIYIYFLTDRGDLVPVRALPMEQAARRAEAELAPHELHKFFLQAVSRFKTGNTRVDVLQRARTTFEALEALRASIALLPGRKSLVWITSGLPLTVRGSGGGVDFTSQVESVSDGAARAGISIYTVALPWTATAVNVSSSPWIALKMISEMTGGRWYSDHGLTRCMVDVQNDASSAYRLVYASPVLGKSDKPRAIHLEGTRKDVHLLTRSAVIGELAERGDDEWEAVLVSKQRRSAFDATDIGLGVLASRKPGTNAMHFDIRLDPSDVRMEQTGERYTAVLDVSLAYYRDGFYKESAAPFRVNLSLSQGQYDFVLKGGLVIPADEDIREDVEAVRVMIYDRGLHRMGSVTIPMK
jgi:VWFA-related protein